MVDPQVLIFVDSGKVKIRYPIAGIIHWGKVSSLQAHQYSHVLVFITGVTPYPLTIFVTG